MVIDIKMCRFEDVPWGFSLVGGSDFEYPLTVVKVTEGSIADNSGLKVGDVLVRINDIPTSPLTHEESNRILKNVGNIFFLGVQRESEEKCTPQPMFPFKTSHTLNEQSLLQNLDHQSELCEVNETWNQQDYQVITCSEPIDSGSEVILQETNQVLFEKPNIQLIPDESTADDTLKIQPTIDSTEKGGPKTKVEKEEECRKWTTFMQKPDRPIPKSKEDIAREKRAANAYKIKIVKSEPRQRSVSPAICPNTETKSNDELSTENTKPEQKPLSETMPLLSVNTEVTNHTETQTQESQPHDKPEDNAALPVDSEVPNLEITDEGPERTDDLSQVDDGGSENNQNENDVKCEPENSAEIAEENILEENNDSMEQELALQQQLHDVQKQLVALSNLPSTIQSALNSITRQLDELLPSIQREKEYQNKLDDDSHEKQETDIDSEIPEGNEPENVSVIEDNVKENAINLEDVNDNENSKMEKDECSQENVQECTVNKDNDTQDNVEEQMPQKAKQQGVIGELEEHLERKHNTKHSKRAFGPLTPASDRPLVLPGGRRWYRPKDAYNDEFIAEIISAQAELINGSTLGVNFMKYQKPEKKIDLDKSEVYKIIHHLDKKPVRGIEVRPSIVPSAADIKKPDPI